MMPGGINSTVMLAGDYRLPRNIALKAWDDQVGIITSTTRKIAVLIDL
jgi:hypothetical protein